MNIQLFEIINNLVGKYIWLDCLAIFLAVYSGYVLLAFLLYLWFFKSDRGGRWIVFSSLFAAAISRGVITTVIRFFYHHPRPFVALISAKQLIAESGDSFPSGHAAFFFAISAVVYAYDKKIGVVFLISSILMGFARIYTGVHWPLDILGGAIVGLATGLFVNKLRPNKNSLTG